MAKYIVIKGSVRKGGKMYIAGTKDDQVELSAKEAEPLIDAGTLANPNVKKDKKSDGDGGGLKKSKPFFSKWQ